MILAWRFFGRNTDSCTVTPISKVKTTLCALTCKSATRAPSFFPTAARATPSTLPPAAVQDGSQRGRLARCACAA